MEDAFELFNVEANGIVHRVARVKGRFPAPSKEQAAVEPLVVLLHGWPECWYSWRHQVRYTVLRCVALSH